MAVGSFSAGLSGLSANAQALSVIGNNLANINTVAFKESDVTFEELVSQSVGSSSINPTQIGLGVGVASISPVFSQGAIENTNVATNVAIQGNGMFVLEGPAGRSYTRAGDFSFDRNGNLVSPDGQAVQGYTSIDPTTGAVVNSGSLTNINVPPGVLRTPVASTQFQAITNLNASALDGSSFSASIQIYDSLGSSHVATMTYAKTGAGTWDYTMTGDGADVTGGTAGTPFQLATGTLTFDGTGKLVTVDGSAPSSVAITLPGWTNGASGGTLSWNLLDSQNTPVLTSYAAASATSSITQNGSTAGKVSNVTISPDGSIMATVGAGQSFAIGQLAIASFNNPAGLTKVGLNRYGETEAAGTPNVGAPGSGGRGTLIGGALEQSNVDMATEFTQMILAQRGYQANSKTITTSDQILVDTLNLKQ